MVTGCFFRMGVPPIAIDTMSEIAGVTFAGAWKNRITLIVDVDTGLKAHFISRADLITAKLAASSAQDLGDVEALRNAAQAPLANAPKRKRLPKKKA
jgi:hypothetical protein